MFNELNRAGDTASTRRELLGWALGLFAVSPFLLAALFSLFFTWENPQDARRLAVMRQMAAETSAYPGSAQADTTEMAKSTNALLLLHYHAPAAADFEGVKSFYDSKLRAGGWGPLRDEDCLRGSHEEAGYTVCYRKGEYTVSVGPGERPKEYYVTYTWRRP